MSDDSVPTPESKEETENKLVGTSIPGPTNTADVTSDKTPITTEEQVKDQQK